MRTFKNDVEFSLENSESLKISKIWEKKIKNLKPDLKVAFMNTDEDGIVFFEYWKEHRHLTIDFYIDEPPYFSQSLEANTISAGSLTDENLLPLLNWLTKGD